MLKIWLLLSSFLLLALSKPLLAREYVLLAHTSPPYVNQSATQGIAVDIIQTLFSTANIEHRIENYPLARAIRLAEQKPGFCVFPIHRTQERESLYKWVSPVLISHITMFSNNTTKKEYSVLADVKNESVGVLRGSALESYLTNSKHPFVVDTAGSELQNIKKLKAGRINFWATDANVAAYYATQSETELLPQFVFSSTLRALACHISTPQKTIDLLTKELRAMYKAGTIHRYFNIYESQHDTKYLLDFNY